MKKRVKTVKEYDEICSEKAEGYVFLPEKDMDCLVEYVQTLGKTLRKKEEAPATPPAPPAPTKEEVLLMEIRDLLKEQKK